MTNLTQSPLFKKLDWHYITKEELIFNQQDAFPLDKIKNLEYAVLFLEKINLEVPANPYFTERQKEETLKEREFMILTLKVRINQLKKQL